MKKQKVLFVAEELGINGAMMSLLALLKALPADKYDITLFLMKHGGELMSQIPECVKVLPESLPYAIHRMPRVEAYKRALKHGRLDLILYRFGVSLQRKFGLKYRLWPFLPRVKGHYDVACCYTDGFVAPMIIRKVFANRKVCWIHYPYSIVPQTQDTYEALSRADMCVPVSKEAASDLQKVLGIAVRYHIVHNIIDATRCRELANDPIEKEKIENVARIISVGRVSYPKYFDIIPLVAQRLKKEAIKFEWIIIGNGDQLDELSESVKKQNLSDCVHFIGERNNPMPWIKSADVFVNPSRYESWGMTVSEALCLGKAVITSDIPVFAEQITNEQNGLMCPAIPEKLADAIIRVITDEQLKSLLEENAIRYPFTKEVIIQEFDAMIEELIR